MAATTRHQESDHDCPLLQVQGSRGTSTRRFRGEPRQNIPRGTEFEDLPEDYVCAVCGIQGKGKIGSWAFEEWIPTKYVCRYCGYVYDEKRGEPQHGIAKGTKFEDLPDDYVCTVCMSDERLRDRLGKVGKEGLLPRSTRTDKNLFERHLSGTAARGSAPSPGR